jgi:Lon protease-like protein
MPMFPLGSVLVPSMVLPLHVFEPRYRQLVRDCLDGTPEFGVVLIQRGSEVGGGDVRTEVGTVARMVEAAELPDGRYALHCVGTRRIRVERWLDDAPYPRAEVEDWPDEPDGPPGEAAGHRERALGELRRALALQAELGEPAPPATVDVDPDPEVAGHQIAALAPIGPLDRQRLLAVPGTAGRLVAAHAILLDAVELLEARLALG